MKKLIRPAVSYLGQKRAALRAADRALSKMSDGETKTLKSVSVAGRAIRVHKGYHSGAKQFSEPYNNRDGVQYSKKMSGSSNMVSKGESGQWERASIAVGAFPKEKLPSNTGSHLSGRVGTAAVSRLGRGSGVKKGSSGHSGG